MGKLVADITMSLDGFITGPDSALKQARTVAGDKDVGIGGGADVIQQYLAAGLVDEFRLHLAPVLLGTGKRLFDHLGSRTLEFQQTRVIESPYATHLFFTVRH
jgi:dihydrofolate reductase